MSCFRSAVEVNIKSCVSSGYERIMSGHVLAIPGPSTSKTTVSAWIKTWWTKVVKRQWMRRRLFDRSSPTVPYDPHSYSQNFDHSTADPDNLSRSFSARFAVPSRVFHEGTACLVGS